MTKIYLHYDGKRGPGHTFVWKTGGDMSTVTGVELVNDALSAFVRSYTRKHSEGTYDGGKGMDAGDLRLVVDNPSGRGRPVPMDTTSDGPIDPELVFDGCDLRIEEIPEEEKPAIMRNGKGTPREGGREGALATALQSAPSVGSVRVANKTIGPDVSPAVDKLMIKAEKHVASKQLRKARDALNKALKLDPHHGAALRCLADVYISARLLEEAFSAAKECCASARDSAPEDFMRAGRCLVKLGKYAEARTAFARARCAGQRGVMDDADAALALCSVNLGDAQGGAALYLQVLERTNEKHVEALVGYGQLAAMVNQIDKGLPSLLKAIVIQQEHKLARESLAAALGTPEGMEALKEQVEPLPDTASVYSFLGTVTKEHGEIDASVELLRLALLIDPTKASAALALVHGHEITGDHEKALAEATSYLRGNPNRSVGKRGSKSSDILSVLEDDQTPSKDSPTTERLIVHWASVDTSGTSSMQGTTARQRVSSGQNTGNATFAWCSPASDEQSSTGDGESAGDEGKGAASYRAWIAGDTGQSDGRGAMEVYPSEDLDLLALYFAVVKVLYLLGRLSPLPLLLQRLEPTRVRSVLPLHRTSIRNEQAYYCCIAQLLSRLEDTTTPMVGLSGFSQDHSAAEQPGVDGGDSSDNRSGQRCSGAEKDRLYVCGDSHTLTPAWRQVTIGDRRHVLRPALVTGLKHWHLRSENTFYPKKNFERVLRKIPDGAAIVFVFGEIDCREGILLAVEKLRYNNVEEGMEHTAGIFIKVAEAAVKQRGFRAFIHPVVPVLAETRPIVKAYNRVLRRKVDKSKYLHWLDFFDDLLDESGSDLVPEFRLDGTHLSPSYLRLLGRALGNAWIEAK